MGNIDDRKITQEIHDLAHLRVLSKQYEIEEANIRTKRRVTNKKIDDILETMAQRELVIEREDDK